MQTKIKKLLQKNALRWVIVAQAVILAAALSCIVFLPGSPAVQTPTEPPSLLAKNPYTPEQFSYAGDYLSCTAGTSSLGIDVSEWQGEIDWQQVRSAGVEFVMVRIGWRGSEQGVLSVDTMAQTYYEGAVAAGLRVGGYFFSQAINPEEAQEEARFVLDAVKDWQIDMPIAYDWEYISDESRTASVDNATLTQCVAAFCSEIEQAGYSSMLYFNTHHAVHRLDLEVLRDFGFWFALYDGMLNTDFRVDMWQYTDRGSVPGIEGNVDINLHLIYEES